MDIILCFRDHPQACAARGDETTTACTQLFCCLAIFVGWYKIVIFKCLQSLVWCAEFHSGCDEMKHLPPPPPSLLMSCPEACSARIAVDR